MTRTCKEWPLAYETEHNTFKTMTLNQHAIQLIANGTMDAEQLSLLIKADLLDPAANIDWLQMARVCTVLSDAQEIVLKGTKEAREQAKNTGEPTGVTDYAIAQARRLYPDKTEANKMFKHLGLGYKAENRGKYKMVDANGEPLTGALIDKLARLDAKKQDLSEKQKDLTQERRRVLDQIVKKYHLEQEDDWTLHVMR